MQGQGEMVSSVSSSKHSSWDENAMGEKRYYLPDTVLYELDINSHVPWRMNPPEMISDEVLLDSGRTFQVTDPYYYEDALRDEIVQEVLFPSMITHWFT